MFPSVIPLSGTDCSRVTHPSAARRAPESTLPARLACVKHAASVRPEPGSNSDVQSYSSSTRFSKVRTRQSPSPQFASSRRLLSQKSDCSFLFPLFSVSFSRIAPRVSLAAAEVIIPIPAQFVNTFFRAMKPVILYHPRSNHHNILWIPVIFLDNDWKNDLC